MVPQMILDDSVVKEEVLVDDSYVCQFCGLSLNSYVELRTHMKLHAHQKVSVRYSIFTVIVCYCTLTYWAPVL